MFWYYHFLTQILIVCRTKKSGTAKGSTDFYKYDKFPILDNLTKTPRPWLSPELSCSAVLCPEELSDLNHAMQVPLVFLVPLLLQSPVFLQCGIIRSIFLLVVIHKLPVLGTVNLLPSHRRLL